MTHRCRSISFWSHVSFLLIAVVFVVTATAVGVFKTIGRPVYAATCDPAKELCFAPDPNLRCTGGNTTNCYPVCGPNDDPIKNQCVAASGCSGIGCIEKYAIPAVNMLSGLVGILATISIVYAGIRYSSAQGDSGKLVLARKRIGNTIAGVIAWLFLYALMNWLLPGGVF